MFRPTWEEARQAAEARSFGGVSGHVATLTSEAERLFVMNNTEFFTVRTEAWIGGAQEPDAKEPAGGWFWITGEPWEYQPWAHVPGFPPEPNDITGGTEDFVGLMGRVYGPDAFGRFNDQTGDYTEGYLVEYPVVQPGVEAVTPAVESGVAQAAGDRTVFALAAPIGQRETVRKARGVAEFLRSE